MEAWLIVLAVGLLSFLLFHYKLNLHFPAAIIGAIAICLLLAALREPLQLMYDAAFHSGKQQPIPGLSSLQGFVQSARAAIATPTLAPTPEPTSTPIPAPTQVPHPNCPNPSLQQVIAYFGGKQGDWIRVQTITSQLFHYGVYSVRHDDITAQVPDGWEVNKAEPVGISTVSAGVGFTSRHFSARCLADPPLDTSPLQRSNTDVPDCKTPSLLPVIKYFGGDPQQWQLEQSVSGLNWQYRPPINRSSPPIVGKVPPGWRLITNGYTRTYTADQEFSTNTVIWLYCAA